jgi:predicted RNA-binding protein YlqC (UPF0109 family)
MTQNDTVTSEVAQIVTDLVRGVCSEKNKVTVTEFHSGRGVTISIVPSHKDYGRVVGTKARKMRALELLTKLMAAKDDTEARISIVPPEDRRKAPEDPFQANPKWGKAQLKPLVTNLCAKLFRGGVINIQEIDTLSLSVEIRVNEDEIDDLTVFESGEHVRHVKVVSASGEQEWTEISAKIIEDALRTIFFAAGKANGRNVCLDLITQHIPNAK